MATLMSLIASTSVLALISRTFAALQFIGVRSQENHRPAPMNPMPLLPRRRRQARDARERCGYGGKTRRSDIGTTAHAANLKAWPSQRSVNMKTRFITLLLTYVSLQTAHAAEQLPAAAFTSKATGTIELSVPEHSPLYVEVEHSPALSIRLADALASEGFTMTQNKASAKAVLAFRGDIAMVGGPTYVKGVKVRIGDAVEKSLEAAKASGGMTQTELVQTAAGMALNKAAFDAAISPFWRGLALSGMASVIGESTGLKGSFNKALTGDPRGVCLSRCDDWNKVNQTVYLWISLQAGETKSEIRVLTKALSETVAPDQVLDRAMTDGLEVLKLGKSAEAKK